MKTYKTEMKMPEDTMKEYEKLVPQKVISIWNEYGIGSTLDGYLDRLY